MGPQTEATPNIAPNIPWNMGRLWSGIVSTMMITHPLKMPAAPRPAIARPTMKAFELGAAPQTVDFGTISNFPGGE